MGREHFLTHIGKEKMKIDKITKIFKKIIGAFSLIFLLFALNFSVFAEEYTEMDRDLQTKSGELSPEGEEIDTDSAADDYISGSLSTEKTENTQENPENEEKSPAESTKNQNLFEEIYNLGVENADKIFSVLAFIGTLIVGVGYKSGLLPLLRDALSKLKGAIDQTKEENDKNSLTAKEKMEEISSSIEKIEENIRKNGEELSRIEWQFESYEALLKERAALRTILARQIDMLYAIFMTSSLPQYQKEEIGEKIQKMREELNSYEIAEN